MTTALHNNAPAEVDATDASARCPLSLLIASGLLWLVLGGGLALLNLVQLYTPAFLADCAWFTYGRLQAMQETALVYGWAANAGLAVALWLLARLGGNALRGLNYITVGALFWNLGITLSLVGIALGDATSFSLLQMPRYVQPILLFAFAAIAVPGVLAWTGRRAEQTFAAQWYAVAALFLFPWFFSVAQVLLTFLPVRGTLQAVVTTWYAQNVFSLWLAPLAIAAIYYLVPKINGRVIPNYDFAIYGFWSLIVFGTWMGGRFLIGSPVPAWIPTMAIVSAGLVLFHHIILFYNLRGVFRPAGSTTLRFLAFGLGAYLVVGVLDFVFAKRAMALVTQFTYFQQAQGQLAFAAYSLIIFGALYYIAPRLVGAVWPSAGLIRGHFLASLLGFGLVVGSLMVAGWTQGQGLNDATRTFAQIAGSTRVWLQLATVGQAVLIFGNLLLLVHFIKLLVSKPAVSGIFRQPATMEASVS
jgi:cytochrome c oxidase cbb3-type subunit 1